MAATVRDVAKKAGVSLGTVSRFLNGYSLREDNYFKVKDAIDQLGFKENIIAKGLKNNRTMTIGVVIVSLTDIFATSIVTSVERVLEDNNYSIILCDYEAHADKQEKKLRFLKDRSIDGLILYPSGQYLPILDEYLKDDIPVVLVNEDIPGLNTDKVLVDNANASFRAVEKLIHLNHRRIGVINGTDYDYVSQERLRGYKDALQVYEIPMEQELVKYGKHSNAGGYHAARELMLSQDPPTALFVTNYYMTIGAMMAINEMNIKVPQDLSIIGFDRFDLMDVIRPALTVIEQPSERIGEIAAELLLKRIRGDYSDFPKTHQLNTKMLNRDSVKEV